VTEQLLDQQMDFPDETRQKRYIYEKEQCLYILHQYRADKHDGEVPKVLLVHSICAINTDSVLNIGV
jgi:hypothetical protein